MDISRQRDLLAVYRDGLLDDTLPFWWPRCVDEEHGGFLLAARPRWLPSGHRQGHVAAVPLHLVAGHALQHHRAKSRVDRLGQARAGLYIVARF